MRRLHWLVAAIALALVVVPVLSTNADAALPLTKDWAWRDDVEGPVRDVSVCKGRSCASEWATSATADETGANHRNFYGHSRSTQRVWQFNPNADTDVSGFAGVAAPINDAGTRTFGLANQMVDPLLEDPKGPYWVIRRQGGVSEQGSPGDLNNANENLIDAEAMPGTFGIADQSVYAFGRSGSISGESARLWLFEEDGSPYSGWDEDGETLPGTLVEVTTSADFAIAAANDGGLQVRVFRSQGPTGNATINGTTISVNGDVSAVAASRQAPDGRNTIVVGTDDGEGFYLVDAELSGNNAAVELERVAQRVLTWDVNDVEVSADGDLIAVGGDGGLRVYERTGVPNDPLRRLWSTGEGVSDIALSQDGRYLAVGTPVGVRFMRVQPTPDGDPVALWKNTDVGSVVDLDTGYGGSGTIVGANDGYVYYFDLDHSISLSPDVTSQELVPGSDNVYSFDVENAGDSWNRIKISVDSDRSDWVEFQVGDDPPTSDLPAFSLLPDEVRTVDVIVRPPPGTDAGTTFDGTVVATSRSAPGVVRTEQDISGQVERTHSVALSVDEEIKSIKQGQTIEFDLTVINGGNLDDTITLSLGPTSSGWRAFLDRDRFPLDAGASDNATLSVTAPPSVSQGQAERISVQASSQGNPQKTTSLTLTAQVGESIGVRIVGPDTVSVRPGTANPVPVSVENSGNAGQTFNLEVQAPGGWGAVLSEDTVTLQPGDSQEVTVTITPPGNAQGVGSIKISATSSTDSQITGSRTIIAEVDRGFLGLPGFEAALVVLAVAGALVASKRRLGP